MGPCEFCEELCSNCKTITGFEESGKGRIIASYAYWRLIPTMGCFTKGYTLVVNAMHRESLYYCSGDEIIELCSFLRLIKRKYKEAYNTGVFMFEHGTVNKNKMSPASVNHVHLHVFPKTNEYKRIIDMLRAEGCPCYCIADLLMLEDVVNKHHIGAYILCWLGAKYYLFDITENGFQSQYLRKKHTV